MIALTRQQLRALAAGTMVMLVQGSLYVYGSLTPYILTYLHNQGDTSLTISQLAIILTLSVLMTNAGIFIANVPLFSLSNKAISLVCVCGISASMVLLSLATKFAWYVLVYGVVFGLFIGYGYMAPIKNCYSHLPDRKGLCSGVCLTGFGLGALFFNLILTGLINPNNEKQTDHLFPVYVGNRLPFALQMISIVYLAVGMLGVLLMTPPSDTADTKGRYSRMEALRLAIYDQTPRQMGQSQNFEQQILTKEFISLRILRLVISRRIYILVIMLFCSAPYGMFVAFNYKEYGQTAIFNDQLLSLFGSLGSVANGFFRAFWGILLDRFAFSRLSTIISCLLLVSCATIRFAVLSESTFAIAVICTYACYGGLFSLYPTQTVRILGKQIGSKVYYLTFLGFSIGCIIQYLLHVTLVDALGPVGYDYCFLACGSLLVVAVVLSLSVEFTCHPTEVIYLQGNAKDEEIILPENQNPTPAVRPDQQ